MEINKITNLLNLEHVKFLISIFKENNIEIRLVGGCIRDALLEREIKDIDTAIFPTGFPFPPGSPFLSCLSHDFPAFFEINTPPDSPPLLRPQVLI